MDDGYIASTDSDLLQESIDILVDLFERVGLRTITLKTKAQTCIPGKIRTKLSAEVYYNSQAGFHTQEEWNRRRVSCDICDANLSAASLTSHLETQHDAYPSRVIDREFLVDREPVTYTAYQSAASGNFHCPVEGCVGKVSTKWALRRHFCDRHPTDLVNIVGEGTYPQCDRCGMQTNPTALAGSHYQTQLCREGTLRREQRQAAVESGLSLEVVFTAYGEQLERVDVFKYLGRLLAMDDNDMQAVRSNLKKARKVWQRFSRLLTYCVARTRNQGYAECSIRLWYRRFYCLVARLGP